MEVLARLPISQTAISPMVFQKQFDQWLKQHEAAKPFHTLRELEARIREGDRKIGAALKAGNVTPKDDKYKQAMAKLEGLRKERDELRRTAQVPHLAMAVVHDFLRATRGMGLKAGSRIEIQLPGSIDLAVDLSDEEPPF